MGTINEDLHQIVDLLDENQKQVLFQFLVKLPKNNGRISLDQYNQELMQAEMRMDNGQFTTNEELLEEAKHW